MQQGIPALLEEYPNLQRHVLSLIARNETLLEESKLLPEASESLAIIRGSRKELELVLKDLRLLATKAKGLQVNNVNKPVQGEQRKSREAA